MRQALIQILTSYGSSVDEDFKNHPLASFIRHDAPGAIKSALREMAEGLHIKGSAGQSKWADSPWLAIMDPIVTSTPESGYYVAYLFPRAMDGLILSLQLGTTMVREEFGVKGAQDELRRLSDLARSRVPEYAERFSRAPINLEPSSASSRSAFYQIAHVFGTAYTINLPSEGELENDLLDMVRLYRLLTSRRGFEIIGDSANAEGEASVERDAEVGEEDRRRFRYHRRIERNRTLASKAKRIHGYICQACGFDFQSAYGDIGKDYIEAHHLTPLSELPEDRPVKLNPARDFAVLCANCHRMIHRKGAPRQLEDFKLLILDRQNN